MGLADSLTSAEHAGMDGNAGCDVHGRQLEWRTGDKKRGETG